ncbi:MAG: hypothetical protein EBZ49_12210 [Proteobacteria bacterium]|nr:hypothetical protein [Pseudomonadota bacterium]
MALKTKNLYIPNSEKPYRLSRSSIESFTGCPRCFYLDKRMGVEPHFENYPVIFFGSIPQLT